jgi:hypothetical protein
VHGRAAFANGFNGKASGDIPLNWNAARKRHGPCDPNSALRQLLRCITRFSAASSWCI